MAAEINNIPYKIYLSEDEMPKAWYNVRADMKVKPAPLLNPGTGKPMGFEDLRPVFCDELIRQELDNDDREIPIPQEILDFYKMYRPSPLVRAYCLEKALGTPAKIYYKFEGNNTSGSHKLKCHCPGLLCQAAGPQRCYHRDRRRPVGHGPVHGLRIPGSGLQGVYGKGQLRAKALPPGSHADLRRLCHSLSL